MEITINVPEQLGKQLQDYTAANDISVNELTTSYWQAIVENNYVDSVHQKEVRERLRAYRAGEVETVPLDTFMAEIDARIEKNELSR